MINWLEKWAEGIIIAVIIGTIIEMIIPEGNNKKYVRTIIGVYIMFNIISPVITKFTSKEVSFSLNDYETYYRKTNTYEELNKSFEESSEIKIEEIYIEKLNEDIKEKLEQKGYVVNNIELEVNTKNNEEYGMITKMNINIDILKEDNKKEENVKENKTIKKVVVNKVSINEGKNYKKNEVKEIPNTEALKSYLSNEYGIETKNIIINNK